MRALTAIVTIANAFSSSLRSSSDLTIPFDAVSTSPGLMARSDTMFSHAATMKWTSVLGGASLLMARADPRVAAL